MTDVTIGVPVYNGAETVEECLRCLLDGTYRDIRVIVSDNCSTDNTAELVEAIAATDKRVVLFKQSKNVGPVGNFRFVAQQAKTPFFAWRAHDDISDKYYIERLRDALLANPNAALVAPHTITSKLNGDKQRPFKPKLRKGESAEWRQMVQAEAGWFYGLYRTEIAKEAVKYAQEMYPHVWGWDYIVILYALLNGGVTGCNEARFIHRIHRPSPATYDFSKKDLRGIAKDFHAAGSELGKRRISGFLKSRAFGARLWRLIFRRVVRLQRIL